MATNLEPIVLRHVEVADKIKALEAELKVLKQHLTDNLAVGSHVIAGWNVIVSMTKANWSAKGKREFTAQHGEADYPELYQTVVTLDTDAAAELLTRVELDAYLLEAKKAVKVI